ncbi:S-adenosylmethionine decarboxylase [Oligoflexus tunisiensis]|uniref:S-adenosylmethionine decarboxylase n=1 Tax=Oligoflexus tunisiensis TaxID=708132 RepID=UPI00159F0D66|nr:S-adenosylmethionine decarboxylase [Oligoflexus tunisiensis]
MKRLQPETPAHSLEGFNNLTKSLRANLYFVSQHPENLIGRYPAAALETMLHDIADRIEAVVLAASRQDYQPWGASALMLLSDGPGAVDAGAVHMHLNKSHLCAHTYPDFGTADDPGCLRIDLDLTSCGTISPLRSLNFILDCLGPTAAVIDYSVRGFTRDATGTVLFQDHPLNRLPDALDPYWHTAFEIFDARDTFPQTWQMKLLKRHQSMAQDLFLRRIMQIGEVCSRD